MKSELVIKDYSGKLVIDSELVIRDYSEKLIIKDYEKALIINDILSEMIIIMIKQIFNSYNLESLSCI